MLPKLRQRLVIVVAMALGATLWLCVSGPLGAPDGMGGLSLTSARIGFWGATLLTAGVGIAAMVLGVIASAMGNPLSGVFAVAGGLCVLSAKGGAIDGWMARVEIPGGYAWLMAEMLVWQMGVAIMVVAIQIYRSPLRTKWPALAFEDHLGVDLHIRMPRLQSAAAGLVCATVGLLISSAMIRTSDVGQVIGSLVIAFGIGGVAAGLIFPKVNPAGVLFGPALAAIVVYAYVVLRFHSEETLLRAWFTGEIYGAALALPIHYVSAGLAGCAMGVGLAQGIEAAKNEVVQE